VLGIQVLGIYLGQRQQVLRICPLFASLAYRELVLHPPPSPPRSTAPATPARSGLVAGFVCGSFLLRLGASAADAADAAARYNSCTSESDKGESGKALQILHLPCIPISVLIY
jgi:hypothetical protein